MTKFIKGCECLRTTIEVTENRVMLYPFVHHCYSKVITEITKIEVTKCLDCNKKKYRVISTKSKV